MLTLSATDVAIARAAQIGTLRLTERTSRFGDTYIAISDEHGLIEIADNEDAANHRVMSVMRRAKGG